MGQCTALSVARPRLHLWRSVPPESAGDGYAGSPDGPKVALAESLCGASDWIDPRGMSGPHRRLQLILSAPNSQIVFQLLPQGTHAFVLGKDAPQTRPIQPPELGSVVERSADCITAMRGERPEEAVPSGDSVLPSIAVDA